MISNDQAKLAENPGYLKEIVENNRCEEFSKMSHLMNENNVNDILYSSMVKIIDLGLIEMVRLILEAVTLRKDKMKTVCTIWSEALRAAINNNNSKIFDMIQPFLPDETFQAEQTYNTIAETLLEYTIDKKFVHGTDRLLQDSRLKNLGYRSVWGAFFSNQIELLDRIMNDPRMKLRAKDQTDMYSWAAETNCIEWMPTMFKQPQFCEAVRNETYFYLESALHWTSFAPDDAMPFIEFMMSRPDLVTPDGELYSNILDDEADCDYAVAYLLKDPRCDPTWDDNKAFYECSKHNHHKSAALLLKDKRILASADLYEYLCIAIDFESKDVAKLLIKLLNLNVPFGSNPIEFARDMIQSMGMQKLPGRA